MLLDDSVNLFYAVKCITVKLRQVKGMKSKNTSIICKIKNHED